MIVSSANHDGHTMEDEKIIHQALMRLYLQKIKIRGISWVASLESIEWTIGVVAKHLPATNSYFWTAGKQALGEGYEHTFYYEQGAFKMFLYPGGVVLNYPSDESSDFYS